MPTSAPRPQWQVELEAMSEHLAVNLVATGLVRARREGAAVTVDHVDFATGSVSWSTDIALTGELRVDPVPGAPLVAVEGNDEADEVAVLDLADGHVIWQGPAEDAWDTQANDSVVVIDGLAVERDSGAELWETTDSVWVSAGTLTFSTSDVSTDSFGILDPLTGEHLWEQPETWGDRLHIIDDVVIVTDDLAAGGGNTVEEANADAALDEASVEAYDLATGHRLWTAPLSTLEVPAAFDAPIVQALGDDLALIAPYPDLDDLNALVLDLASGDIVWQSDSGIEGARGIDDSGRPLVIVEDNGATTVHDPRTGAVLTERPSDYVFPVQGGLFEVVSPVDGSGPATVRTVDFTGATIWGVALGAGDVSAIPIDGGFVASGHSVEGAVLTGYLG